jgi:2-dehydro-3-deoxy-D-gluconate 5-dehydrogenase
VGILDLFRLDGETALVTGCSRGIGRAMAVALAEAGADIIGVGSSLADGDDPGPAVRALGRRFTAMRCDLAHTADRERWLDHLEGQRVDILVNNAGIIRRAPAAEHSVADWRAVLDLNLDAPWAIAQRIGRGMLERGHGRILFTASLLSFQGGITVPGYAASKGAIAQLAKALANEWSGRGVTVNALAPGYIATDATQALRDDAVRAPAILARIPAGRWGRPDDLAGATVFLASRASAYVTGHVLPVDGGWLAR